MSKKQQKMIQSILDLAVSAKVQYNTYLQYSEAKALNNFNDKTFIKNSIDPQKIYDDFINIFTAKINGLYNWCLLLQIGTVAIYKVWFRNIRFTDSDILVTYPLTLTNANFANGDINTNRNSGNFNDTYNSENLNIEQIRLVILMKYYTQKCSGSIENLYSVLGKFLSFYYNQHSGLPYNESKNNTFIVADCLVGSEVQYQGVLYIYYNNLLAEQVDAINPEKESEKIKYVLQFSNILPQNIGQSLRFIYSNPLPTNEQLLEYSKKPQQVWSNPNVANNLSVNLPENMITKTWCNAGANNTDYKIVAIDGQNKGLVNQKYGFTPNYAKELPHSTSFAETMVNLIDNSNNFDDFTLKFKNEILRLSEQVTSIGDDINDPLAPTRQYMNGIFRKIFDNILFYNEGGEIGWSDTISYAKGKIIKEYDTLDNFWVYYQSLIDNNTNPKPTLASHVGWEILNYYYISNIGNVINYIPGSQSDVGLIYTRISGQTINLHNGNVGNGDAYLTHDELHLTGNAADQQSGMVLNKQHLEFRDNDHALVANYSFDNSKVNVSMAHQFKDINMDQFMFNYSGINANMNVINKIFLANGLVMLFGFFDGTDARNVDYSGYGFNAAFPPLVTGATRGGSGDIGCQISNIQVNPNFSQGFTVINCNVGGGYFTFTWFVIGHLANYVGDILAKIREYKSSFYYDDLPEDKKLELRQYYISLDETKDLTKVTAPEWLEAELEGKEL